MKALVQKYWGFLVLAGFDFIYYYVIQLLTTPGVGNLSFAIHWEAVAFIFFVSLLSIWCVRLVKGRMDKFTNLSIPVKYFQILLFSFLLFIFITGGTQFVTEYMLGQQRQLAYIIGNLILFIFLHIIVGNAYIGLEYFRESTLLREDLLRSEKAKTEAELKVLQQQMSPHFLFNNLNTLASLIPQDQKKAVQFTHHLSTIFRYVSQNAKKDAITLREELDFLTHYMALMQIRFGNAYELVQQWDTLDDENVFVVPLSLQIIIENVIKHNSGSRSKPLPIIMTVADDMLIVKNEVRRKNTFGNTSSGIGLQNLQERYQLFCGQAIQYAETDNHFVIQLPLIKKVDD